MVTLGAGFFCAERSTFTPRNTPEPFSNTHQDSVIQQPFYPQVIKFLLVRQIMLLPISWMLVPEDKPIWYDHDLDYILHWLNSGLPGPFSKSTEVFVGSFEYLGGFHRSN